MLLLSNDRPEAYDYDTLFRLLNSGFAVLLADKIDKALAFGVQGYASRSIQEPSGEANIMGAHEGFVETIRTNMSLIRRRLKSPALVMELMVKGEKSRTDLCLCYMQDRVPKGLMNKIRKSLDKIELESILPQDISVRLLKAITSSFSVQRELQSVRMCFAPSLSRGVLHCL